MGRPMLLPWISLIRDPTLVLLWILKGRLPKGRRLERLRQMTLLPLVWAVLWGAGGILGVGGVVPLLGVVRAPLVPGGPARLGVIPLVPDGWLWWGPLVRVLPPVFGLAGVVPLDPVGWFCPGPAPLGLGTGPPYLRPSHLAMEIGRVLGLPGTLAGVLPLGAECIVERLTIPVDGVGLVFILGTLVRLPLGVPFGTLGGARLLAAGGRPPLLVTI